MNILFKSFHNINVPENAIRVIPIPEDFDGFVGDTDTTLEFSSSIALKLLREEQTVQQLIEKMQITIQRGSLI